MPSAGDYIRASDTTRYYCKANQSSVQSIPNNSFTALQFNGTNDVDSLGIHDSVTNNTRFILGLKLGWWWCSGKFVHTGTASVTQSRRSRMLLNGTTGIGGAYSVPTPTYSTGGTLSGFWTSESTTLVQATLSTDYVELQVFQDSGGAVNTTVSGDLRSQFIAFYLGP